MNIVRNGQGVPIVDGVALQPAQGVLEGLLFIDREEGVPLDLKKFYFVFHESTRYFFLQVLPEDGNVETELTLSGDGIESGGKYAISVGGDEGHRVEATFVKKGYTGYPQSQLRGELNVGMLSVSSGRVVFNGRFSFDYLDTSEGGVPRRVSINVTQFSVTAEVV